LGRTSIRACTLVTQRSSVRALHRIATTALDAVVIRARSLAPLVKARGVGMTGSKAGLGPTVF
jgi:hypothetical protein